MLLNAKKKKRSSPILEPKLVTIQKFGERCDMTFISQNLFILEEVNNGTAFLHISKSPIMHQNVGVFFSEVNISCNTLRGAKNAAFWRPTGLSVSFFRITNCVWTSSLKTRKKNRDLKMGFIRDLSERGNTGDRVIPWSYFTRLIVLIVVRAPAPAPPFNWRPEFPHRLSDQVAAHRLLEPQ